MRTIAHRIIEPSLPSVLPTVFIVDDDISVRESLEMLVQRAGWRPQTFHTGAQLLACSNPPAVGCLLLDISLPDVSGFELQQRIAAAGIDLPIIFITGYGDVPTSVRAIKSGAVEFLTKPLDAEVLIAAIGHAIERSLAKLVERTALQALEDRYGLLTRREREVMALVASGLLNKQAGFELGISEITVKAHRGKVMRKMEARSFVDLVNMAAALRRADRPGRAVFGR